MRCDTIGLKYYYETFLTSHSEIWMGYLLSLMQIRSYTFFLFIPKSSEISCVQSNHICTVNIMFASILLWSPIPDITNSNILQGVNVDICISSSTFATLDLVNHLVQYDYIPLHKSIYNTIILF